MTALNPYLGAIALGAIGEIQGALVSTLPPFGWFRWSHRYTTLLFLALAIVAAEGLTSLSLSDAQKADLAEYLKSL